MKAKETIAVIGAASEEGRLVIGYLMHRPYRLLLTDESSENLAALRRGLSAFNTAAEIDLLPCCGEAAWEADMILVAHAGSSLEETARKMKEVATTKTVIIVEDGNPEVFKRLQDLLPHSKLVLVQLSKNGPGAATPSPVRVSGDDPQATESASRLFETAWPVGL